MEVKYIKPEYILRENNSENISEYILRENSSKNISEYICKENST